MAKIKIENYVFDASAQTIEFSDYVSIDLPAVLLITNTSLVEADSDDKIIYNFASKGKGGTVATNVLTLEYDTTLMDDADELQIWYWDITTDEPVEVTNFPAEYPLPAAQVTTLTPPAAIAGFLTETDFDTKAGSLTEGAPATDTASSGLNGRLQRVAQRISSLITALGSPFQAGDSIGNTTFASTIADGADVSLGAKADAEASSNTGAFSLIAFFKRLINTTLAFGQKAKANSISVTLASDQDAITANAGTNLNTSALALEAGNLASIKTAVEVIDNFISGSKGLVTEDNSASIKTAVEALSTNLGAVADAIVAAGATGSLSAKLRRATQGLEDLKTAIVLAAGNNNIGDVDVLTLPADPLGANADASVAAGAVGSISAKLRRATQGLEDLKTGIILAAGSAAIGKLAANSGVDIGDVDITSVVPGTAASNLGKAEDAIFGDGDVGVMALGVRKNTAASTSGSDGDYQPLITNTRGAQWIAVEDGAGGQITSFGGGTQYTEDVAAAADPVGGALIAVRRDTLSTTEVSADGDNIALKATNKGQLHVAAANGDVYITGQGSQTALGNNILLATAGTAALDTLGFKSVLIQIVPTAGTVTAGVIRFEGSNDNVNFDNIYLYEIVNTNTDNTIIFTYTLSTSARSFGGNIHHRYIKARISTGVTGTTTGFQAFTMLSPQAHVSPMPIQVRNNSLDDLYVRLRGDIAQSVGIAPQTSGGLTTYHLVSAGSTNATVVKSSAGQLFGWYIYNSNAAMRKVAFHNASSTPSAGASIFFTLKIPPLSAANVFSDIGISFSTGISITTVTDLADSGTTAVAANDLDINLFYK